MTFKWRLCIDFTDLNKAFRWWYHQILMAEEDQEKMAFIFRPRANTATPGCRSASGTLGRNMEACIDDIVVKTRYKDSLIQDLHSSDQLQAQPRQVRLRITIRQIAWLLGFPSGN